MPSTRVGQGMRRQALIVNVSGRGQVPSINMQHAAETLSLALSHLQQHTKWLMRRTIAPA